MYETHLLVLSGRWVTYRHDVALRGGVHRHLKKNHFLVHFSVDYKGATYNIPVCIWLLLDFPNVAPMSFVVPTKDMQLKVSHHVDHTGKIYLDYLALWSPGVSTILGLIQACREAFGQLPPVFSKVSSSSSCTSSPSVTTTITSTSSSSSGRQQSSDRQLVSFCY